MAWSLVPREHDLARETRDLGVVSVVGPRKKRVSAWRNLVRDLDALQQVVLVRWERTFQPRNVVLLQLLAQIVRLGQQLDVAESHLDIDVRTFLDNGLQEPRGNDGEVLAPLGWVGVQADAGDVEGLGFFEVTLQEGRATWDGSVEGQWGLSDQFRQGDGVSEGAE